MSNITVTKKTSVVDQLEQLHRTIANRAYGLFLGRDGWGDAVGDWLAAERELVWRPAVEVTEQDGTLKIEAALPGADAKDITVEITPQDVVITASAERKHTGHKGQIHQCEFTAGKMFRSLSLPKSVNASKAKADYHNGMLSITVPIAAVARAKPAEVKAA